MQFPPIALSAGVFDRLVQKYASRMDSLLYEELADWYRALAGAIVTGQQLETPTLLELGAGAGHNAFFLRDQFDCTLSDLSEKMLALSRDLNPTCEHVLGDMRVLRVGRSYDAVLVHDAICYMTTETDLRSVMETAMSRGSFLGPPGKRCWKVLASACLHSSDRSETGRPTKCSWTSGYDDGRTVVCGEVREREVDAD